MPSKKKLSRRTSTIYSSGKVFITGPDNQFGRLGKPRSSLNPSSPSTTTPVILPSPAVLAFTGGASDSGRTAILTSTNDLYLFGCDR